MIDIRNGNFIKAFLRFPKKNILVILLILGFGEWFVSDVINFSGGSLGFIILCLGGYFYLKNDEPKFNEPKDLKGWIDICKSDLDYFDELEDRNNLIIKNTKRKMLLDETINQGKVQKISIIGDDSEDIYNKLFKNYFMEGKYSLKTLNELPAYDANEDLPDQLFKSEAILYHLKLPFSAKDLLWLSKIPTDMPIWLIISSSNTANFKNQVEELRSEIPGNYLKKFINLDINKNKISSIPLSFRSFLFNPNKNIENKKKRVLKELHSKWQAEIELIRRIKLKEIQNKNQLIVAASVFASPIPSIDVLSVTVLNSLMIKEIQKIWGCKWTPEMLEKVSKQIIKTAIAQGVIEWSSQTLLNLSKFHGPNWLIAGSFQAISAAYLTRVVSRSLADFMAISKGVTEPDLEFIKNSSDKIVKNAF